MFSFIYRELVSILKQDKKIIIITLITFCCTYLGLLLLTGLFTYEMQSVFSDNEMKQTYNINVTGESDLKKITAIQGIPMANKVDFDISYSRSDVDDGPQIDLDIMWLFPEGWLHDVEGSVPKSMEEGEWFTDKDLSMGKTKVVLSRHILHQFFSGRKIGDSVQIYGGKFEIIGICGDDGKDLYFPAYSVKSIENKNNSKFCIQSLTIQMPVEISETMRMNIEKQLDAYTDGEHFMSEYENMQSEYYMRTVKYVFFILAIYCFCAMVVSGLIRYVFGKHVYDYVIYKICGVKNSYLILIVLTQVFLMVSISYIAGLFIYFLIKPILMNLSMFVPVSSVLLLIIYFSVLTIQMSVSLPIVCKVIRISPMNRSLWRNYE